MQRTSPNTRTRNATPNEGTTARTESFETNTVYDLRAASHPWLSPCSLSTKLAAQRSIHKRYVLTRRLTSLHPVVRERRDHPIAQRAHVGILAQPPSDTRSNSGPSSRARRCTAARARPELNHVPSQRYRHERYAEAALRRTRDREHAVEVNHLGRRSSPIDMLANQSCHACGRPCARSTSRRATRAGRPASSSRASCGEHAGASRTVNSACATARWTRRQQQYRRVARGGMQRTGLRGLDANVDCTVPLRESGQPRNEHLAREERQQRDPQHAPLTVARQEPRRHVVELRQQRRDLRDTAFARAPSARSRACAVRTTTFAAAARDP